MFNNIKDIVLIFLVIGMIYLLFSKFISQKPSENFETQTDTIKNAVNEMYRADIDAIRNLAQISETIMKNKDNLTLPATTTITGNLEVKGNVKFTNKDTYIMEIFPKFMVISWASTNIPKGWVLCDGNYYILDTDGTGKMLYENELNNFPNKIQTPDLRGRFILGSGVGAKDMNGTLLTERKLNDVGGEENHLLIIDEMPSHSHTYGDCRNFQAVARYGNSVVRDNTRAVLDGESGLSGGSKSHNNMPPFYVLTYIMKL